MTDISSTEEFNEALETAGEALVVVDYSTSWCGPCKIIAPKFDEFSEKYSNVKFIKVCMETATLVGHRGCINRVSARHACGRSWATAAPRPTN